MTYNALANEYEARMCNYFARDNMLLAPVISYIKSTFVDEIKALDIGPGTGLDLSIMVSNGFDVKGVDISENMAEICMKVAPAADVVVDNFLDIDLGKEVFHAVISKATLHLFKKIDALLVLKKIYDLLMPRGMAYISTTIGNLATEGIFPKMDYRNQLPRYRKTWTRDELVTAVGDIGFIVNEETYDEELELDKSWLNLYLIKPLPSHSRLI